MATTNVIGTNANFQDNLKTKYGQLHRVIPKQYVLQRDFPFRSSDRLGDMFKEAVVLQQEHGCTYAGAGEDAFALESAVAGKISNCYVQGCQHVMRAYIGQAAAAQARGGDTSFERAFDVVVENLNNSVRKRIEVDMWYGQQGLGQIEALSTTTNTDDTLTITAATWAPGIWAGAEGAVLEIFNESGIAATGLARDTTTFTIETVDLDTRKIKLTAGTTAVAVNDVVQFNGQYDGSAYKTMLGLHPIAAGPATIFGISSGSSLWNPATYAVGSTALSFKSVNKALVKAIARGYAGDMKLYISPNTWADLLLDETALRRHQSGGVKQYEVGAEGIKFYSQTGTITIKASIYCMEGYGYLVPSDKGGGYRRIGATDVTFKPLGENESWLQWVPDYAAYEMRLYDNQAIYSPKPGYTILLSGIVNTA